MRKMQMCDSDSDSKGRTHEGEHSLHHWQEHCTGSLTQDSHLALLSEKQLLLKWHHRPPPL